jgi:hypothetical protein
MGWMVRGSKHVGGAGGRDFPYPSRLAPGAHPHLLASRLRKDFPYPSRLAPGAHPPLLASRLRKDYSYTSIVPPGLHCLLHSKVFHFTFNPSTPNNPSWLNKRKNKTVCLKVVDILDALVKAKTYKILYFRHPCHRRYINRGRRGD